MSSHTRLNLPSLPVTSLLSAQPLRLSMVRKATDLKLGEVVIFHDRTGDNTQYIVEEIGTTRLKLKDLAGQIIELFFIDCALLPNSDGLWNPHNWLESTGKRTGKRKRNRK